MLTQGEEEHVLSDGERSELGSNVEESEDIFRVLNRSKSQREGKEGGEGGEEEEKVWREDRELWKNGIPISPMSARSMPQQPYIPNEWDEQELRKLEQSDNELDSEVMAPPLPAKKD